MAYDKKTGREFDPSNEDQAEWNRSSGNTGTAYTRNWRQFDHRIPPQYESVEEWRKAESDRDDE